LGRIVIVLNDDCVGPSRQIILNDPPRLLEIWQAGRPHPHDEVLTLGVHPLHIPAVVRATKSMPLIPVPRNPLLVNAHLLSGAVVQLESIVEKSIRFVKRQLPMAPQGLATALPFSTVPFQLYSLPISELVMKG
jgi:hypothetical protein